MKTYSVSKVKQLIDLNGDSVNFEINFKVSSRNKEPFDILVVDQATLDSNPNLQYKNVTNGIISGKVRQDKNIYQNHFIILKSDIPCECDVEVSKIDLPLSPPEETQQQPYIPPQSPQPRQPQTQSSPPQQSVKKEFNSDKNDGFHWINILLIGGFVVGIGCTLYWVSRRFEKATVYIPSPVINYEQPEFIPSPYTLPEPAPVPAPVQAPAPVPLLQTKISQPIMPSRSQSRSSSSLSPRVGQNQLLSKLKGLNIEM